ncbi:hypothetical protein [Corallococcus aberystwythensis]|uniref:Uncharacterized protein n=1 Tax=Corallococcus aberystwythensis TaxID=2316722 RepID=A0A3A8R104_9BACT|nr:hypothetical protein [Corallococcus aberystwythensis]RKH74537.1 hypothetical protein D7W81_00860 [Corallococcus aberystwythensis]
MVLELSQQQMHLLHASLAEGIDALRDEVVHTDARDLRDHLRDKLERLQALQRKVEAQMHPAAHPPL